VTIDRSVEGLAFHVDDYRGHYLAAKAALTDWLSDTLEVGLGYRYIRSKQKNEPGVRTFARLRSSLEF
jgi:hypothetical protein